PAPVFQVLKEGANPGGREVFYAESIDPPPGTTGGEGQEQTQRVAVTLLRVGGQVPLADQVLHQEAPDPRTQQLISHGFPPSRRIVQSACRPPVATRASS